MFRSPDNPGTFMHRSLRNHVPKISCAFLAGWTCACNAPCMAMLFKTELFHFRDHNSIFFHTLLSVFRDSVFCNMTLKFFTTYVTIMEIHSLAN